MSYRNLPAHQLPAFLAWPDAVVLDTRDPQSYARDHVAGARPADEAALRELMRGRRKDQPILVYCYRGNSSRDFATFLAGLGFTQVYNLEGGWQAWEALKQTRAVRLSPAAREWAEALGFDTDNANSRIDNGMSMLMVAAMQGYREMVVELLGNGADPNLLNDDENGALWFACYSACGEIADALIAHGADLDNQNVNGATCLIYAASAGRHDMVIRLVEAGADLGRATHDGFTALDSAATLPILRYLRSCPAAA